VSARTLNKIRSFRPSRAWQWSGLVVIIIGFAALFLIHIFDTGHRLWPQLPFALWLLICLGAAFVLRGRLSPGNGFLVGISLALVSFSYAVSHIIWWQDHNLFFPIAVAAVGFVIASFYERIRLDRFLRSCTKHTREAMAVGIALCLVGIALAPFTYFHKDTLPDKFDQTAVFALTFLLTTLMLVLAVYSIRGYLDRPIEISDVLNGIADMIRAIKREPGASSKRGFVLFICEYAGIGVLTQLKDFPTGASAEEDELLDHYHTELPKLYSDFNNSRWRVVMVCPQGNMNSEFSLMDKHIHDYAKNNDLLNIEQYAQSLNRRIVTKYFDPLNDQSKKDDPSKNRFKWWHPILPVPKYQAVVVGVYGRENEPVVPKEAIVFFALDSPPPVELGTSSLAKCIETAEPLKTPDGTLSVRGQIGDRKGSLSGDLEEQGDVLVSTGATTPASASVLADHKSIPASQNRADPDNSTPASADQKDNGTLSPENVSVPVSASANEDEGSSGEEHGIPPNATSAPGDHEKNGWHPPREEVPILAWHLTDRRSLRGLMAEAKKLSDKATDQQLLGISKGP
jgi:hypothetical protein